MSESEDRPELSQDALVEALVPDPDHLPDVIMLQGFLGRGGAEGTWRLYFTQDLDDYVDIPADKIVHSRRLPEDRGTMVWVPKGLVLEHKRIASEDVQAEFLAGPITSGLRVMGAADPLGMRGAALLGPVVHVSLVGCPSKLTCPISVFLCPPSVPWPCGVISHQNPCPGQSIPGLSCQ